MIPSLGTSSIPVCEAQSSQEDQKYSRFERQVNRLVKHIEDREQLMVEALKIAPNRMRQEEIYEITSRILAKKQRKEFKKQLGDIGGTDIEFLAKKLFDIMPKSMELEDVVNIEFKKFPVGVPNLIKAIRLKHPLFTLSSTLNQMRLAILEDGQHVLTNQSLYEMIPIHESEGFDKNKLNLCYDLAHRLYHPHIYHPSTMPVTPNEYTLNFLWINLNPQDRIQNIAQNIFKDGQDLAENAECLKHPDRLRVDEKEEFFLDSETLKNWINVKKSFTYRLSKWADIHPGTEMNLWYDSALVTEQAREKTSEILKGISCSRGVNLKLRDIRVLANLDKLDEIQLSLHPGTPVYYRVDILKALIADHMISPKELEGKKYCVVSDIDITPVNAEQMFNQRILNFLDDKGYVFQASERWGFENSFFIFNRDHRKLPRIHREMTIDAIESQIYSLRKYPLGKIFDSELILDSQCVFRKYNQFHKKMGETICSVTGFKINPRIIVQSPKSQFIQANFLSSNFQAESFRFIGNSPIPYTRKGRNFEKDKEESQIETLIRWKAEPLPESDF